MANKLIIPVRRFIEKKLKENFPDFDFRRSTALNDLVANTSAFLLQPFRHELDMTKLAQSLKNHPFLKDEEVDDLLFNIFISRIDGNKSVGIVRIFFFELGDFAFETLTFLTNSGLRFINSAPISITPENLTVNLQDDGTYFFDIIAESEDAGGEFAINVGEIVGLDNPIPEIARVTNPFSFSQGKTRETNFDLFKRSQDAIITRNLLNEFSIRTILFNEFPAIRDIKVIPAGDPAMLRDLVECSGRKVHTYGKCDIYIDTTSLQESAVDISFIPGDDKIDLIGELQDIVVFPIQGTGRSSSGNTRGLFFTDAIDSLNLGNDNVLFNNALRIFNTEFGVEVFKDFTIKHRTPQDELIVVDTKLQEGSSLIPFRNGFLDVDRNFSEDFENKILFKGGVGQGDDFREVSINGANFLAGTLTQTVTLDGTIVDTDLVASASADAITISIANFSSLTATVDLTKNPTFISTLGDGSGGYPIFAVNTTGVNVEGQRKFTGTAASTVVSANTITTDESLDRSVKIGDFTRLDKDIKAVKIDALDFSVNQLVFDQLISITAGEEVKIFDGIQGKIQGEPFFISEDQDYTNSQLLTSYNAGTLLSSFGDGGNKLSQIFSSVALSGFDIEIGDTFIEENGNQFPIIASDPNRGYVVIRGELTDGFTATDKFKIEKPNGTDAQLVLEGLVRHSASGQFAATVNSVTPSGSVFIFKHPNIAVGLNQTGIGIEPPAHQFVNITKGTSHFFTADIYSSTFGIGGIDLQTDPNLEEGDFWAITPFNTEINFLLGGSTHGENFTFYDNGFIGTIDNVAELAGDFPNDNPDAKFVIAGGPNKGIYDIVEITDNHTVKLDVELDIVSTITGTNIIEASYNEGETQLLSEGSPKSAEPGDTLRITSGLAQGFYRIRLQTPVGYVLNDPLLGNLFGAVDTYEIHKDLLQPFFFIKNQDSLQYEIWSKIEAKRRMDDGENATTAANSLTKLGKSFNLVFSDFPASSADLTFIDGDNKSSTVQVTTFSLSPSNVLFFSPSATAATNNKYEIKQDVLNLNQQQYQVIENFQYYDDTFFVLPIVAINEIVEIDTITGEILGDPLVEDKEFFLLTKGEAFNFLRYSAQEEMIIRFLPKFRFRAMRVTYVGDPTITTVDQFIQSEIIRTVNNDTLVKRMESTLVDVSIGVEGIGIEEAEDVIDEYITTRKSDETIQASDMIDLLYNQGATYVNTETLLMEGFHLHVTEKPPMFIVLTSSKTEIASPKQSTYIPRNIIVNTVTSGSV